MFKVNKHHGIIFTYQERRKEEKERKIPTNNRTIQTKQQQT